MTALITPLSITIKPRGGVGYKSISELLWSDIPGLSIVTGKNGSGKTQLLEILAHHFSRTVPHGYPQTPEVTASGTDYGEDEVGYISSGGRFSGGTSSSIANISSLRQNALHQLRQPHNYSNDMAAKIRFARIMKKIGNKHPSQITDQEFSDIVQDNIDLLVSDVDITEGLSHIFFSYRIRVLEGIELGTPGFDRTGNEIGPSPWDVINEALRAAGFPYKVTSPASVPLTSDYVVDLIETSNDRRIRLIDLSSGEKVLLQLILWLFTVNKNGIFPKLLLLDEPDAHLHPSMTVQFLDVISEVLVSKHGIRVIMTSHSPSTVALAPVDSVFELVRGSNEIKRVDKRSDIITVLTAGLVTVSRSTKFCFVEDEDDVSFYEAVREILTDYGPSQDPMSLRPSPSIAFVPVSVSGGGKKITGGSSIVRKWIDKLDTDPLDRTFLGIIDRDQQNSPGSRIFVLNRFSFENYLLDPIVIFTLILEENTAPHVDAVNIGSGDEHLLRSCSSETLQKISNKICSKMESHSPTIKTSNTVSVTYSRGQTINVPSWVIDYRGHDLLPIAQCAFGGARVITPPKLIKALRRCRLVPKELAALLSQIQHV